MACIPRLTVDGESAIYHIILRAALDGFVLGDGKKEGKWGDVRELPE